MMPGGQVSDMNEVRWMKSEVWWKEYKLTKTIDMKKYELMALPYAPEALEPVISKETIGFHHGKHLQAYVDNLNKLLPGSEYEGMALE